MCGFDSQNVVYATRPKSIWVGMFVPIVDSTRVVLPSWPCTACNVQKHFSQEGRVYANMGDKTNFILQ